MAKTPTKIRACFKRVGKGQYNHGVYDVAIAINNAKVKVSADGKKYLMIDKTVTIRNQMAVDHIYVRPKLRVQIWVDVTDQKAFWIKHRRALRAAIIDSPILL